MERYDVIVIGAGNGGLAAACKVLNAGKTCLVCEKHNIPGGFATSFVRGRFEFEASLHEFNGIGTPEEPGSTRILFEELGVADKIEWVHLKDAYHLISAEEGYDYVMPFGTEAFAKANNQLHPEGEKYIRDFFALAQQIRDAMDYLSASKGRPDPQVMMEKYPDMVFLGGLDVQNLVDVPGVTEEAIRKEVRRCIDTYGKAKGNYIIYGALVSLHDPAAYGPGGKIWMIMDEANKYTEVM